jgi:alpha-glucosidase
MRVASRWGGVQPEPALLRLAAALQMSLRGSACIYQGDELGLPEAAIAYEDLQDPYGIAMWPDFKGRDGCRTPMPWAAKAADLGFSPDATTAKEPWLPITESYRALAVDIQDGSADSLLNFYRQLLHWRKKQPALMLGDLTLLAADPQILAYVRSCPTQRILCLFNLSGQSANWGIPADYTVSMLLSEAGSTGATLTGRQVEMEPWTGLFVLIE